MVSPLPRTSLAPQGEALLRARWRGPVIVSYAQNCEDVRLWRAFGGMAKGFYVDVGAGDPVTHSVTKLFYDAGWHGIDIEPGPNVEELRRARPNDVTLDVAIGSERAAAEFWISSPDAGLSSFVRPDDGLLPRGFSVSRTTVRKERLTDILRDHATGREIDFLKIHAGGGEREVLESLDLESFRPRIILAEAISPLDFRPTYAEWEPLLVERGYLYACFDGLNRFYVRDDEQQLIPVLDYPVTVLDRYVLHDSQWRRDTSIAEEPTPSRAPISWEPPYWRSAEADAREARRQLEAVQATLSWRVTRPLRVVRRKQLLGRGRSEPPGRPEVAVDDASALHLEHACSRRLVQTAGIFASSEDLLVTGERGPVSLDDAALRIESALDGSGGNHRAKAWVVLTAVDGRYPDDEAVDAVARMLRASGPRTLGHFLKHRFEEACATGAATDVGLEVVRERVVVASEAMVTSDIHTGIQRVARECVSRWLAIPSTELASFDVEAGSLKLLSPAEHERVRRWRDHMPDSGSEIRDRSPQLASRDILVPWNCRVLVPELLLQRRLSRALATMARAGVSRTLSFIGYDLIPIVAPETVDPGLSEAYCEYLSAVKRADHVSAISERSARDFEAYTVMLESEGLTGPTVRAHSLPTPAPSLSEEELVAGTAALRLEGLPLVVVVGVHVPRKNHLAVLEASERLWIEGHAFELLFIGGVDRTSGREFDGYVERLRRQGWPVRVLRRASEAELWAAYATARFSVYPSLLEGFGLPVAESLASGTPVITSSHGSMAEIAAGGGAVLVDPLDIDAITSQMRRLLADDALVERLRREARGRDLHSWDDYARDVWGFFTSEPSQA